MRSIGEAFYFSILKIFIKIWSWNEERRVRSRYYTHPLFNRLDRALQEIYAGLDPYLLSKEFLLGKGAKEIYAYGETPLTVLEEICKRFVIQPYDKFVDLGCGRGRSLFFIATHFDCRAVGIEQISDFVERGNRVAQSADLHSVRIVHQDILDADLSDATIVYLYGTCLEEAVIERLIEKFARLQRGTRIISVSFPLSDYCQANLFRVQDEFTVRFPWGRADVYIQERV